MLRVLESNVSGIVLFDSTGRVLHANDEFLRIVGRSRTELEAGTLNAIELTGPQWRSVDEAALEALRRDGKHKPYEKEFLRSDGSTVPVLVSLTFLSEHSDCRVGFVVDLAERKRVEQALREIEHRYELAARAGRVGVWDLNVLTGELYLAPNLKAMLGYGDAELPNTLDAWVALVHPDDRELVLAATKRHLEGKTGEYEVEVRRRHKDGNYRWFLARGSAIRDAQGNALRLTGSDTDITERKQAIEALAESEQRLQIALSANEMGTIDWEVHSGGMVWNDGLFRIVGAEPFAFEPSYEAFRRTIHPEDREAVETELGRAMAEHVDFSQTFRVRWPDDSVHWLSARGTFFYDVQARPYRMLGVMFDVTELQRAKHQAEAANRAKDQFIAVLSHELRTPLTPVLTTVQMLERQRGLSADTREALVMIRRNVELETRLIDDLLDLTRIARGKLELQTIPAADVHDKVQHVLRIIESDARAKQLTVELELKARRHYVRGDPARLQQVLWNLLKNAIKFTPEGGRIVVRTSNDSDGKLRIAVCDNGVGIEPAVLPKIFDSFEQGSHEVTRQFGGLGLGLAITKALVEMHGGAIDASSEGPGCGSTFTITFPVVSSSTSTKRVPSLKGKRGAEEPIGLGDWRVLLVEDNADTAKVMAQLLSSRGFGVRTADTVASALQAAQAERFDLVISDIGLPDGSGCDLMKQLLAKLPIKGIAISGFGMEEDVRRSHAAGFSEHLTKPVNLQKLESTIAKMMETAD